MAQVNPLNLATPAHKYHKLPPLILHPFADTKAPDKAVLLTAGKHLFETYPEEDVRLYFTTLVLQDPTVWGGLEEVLG